MPIIHGTFTVKMQPPVPGDVVDGVSVGVFTLDKVFVGPLSATSVVTMVGCRTPVATDAAYVAVERVTGTIDGRSGTFVLVHRGWMEAGALSLTVSVAPSSATGALAGLRGEMTIEQVDGDHRYQFDYTLPAG